MTLLVRPGLRGQSLAYQAYFVLLKDKPHEYILIQLQARDRRTYGPPTSDINLYDQRRQGQLPVAFPETGFTRQWPEIPRDYLKVVEELGSGAFGVVRKGYLMRNNKVIECAVKMLKSK